MTFISNTEFTGPPNHKADARLTSTPLRQCGRQVGENLPALLLNSISGAAFAVRVLPRMATFGSMSLSIGIAYHNIVGTAAWVKQGVTFLLRRLLRIAINSLGLQLMASQLIEVGGRSFTIIAATFTNAHDEDIAYTGVHVTVFGSLAMFTYALLPRVLHLDPQGFGLWAGAAIHEIAQLVAVAFRDGEKAGELGTIAKLSRVMLLAPTVIAIGLTAARNGKGGKSVAGTSSARPPVPWLVLIVPVGVNSLDSIPADAKARVVAGTTFLMSVALAAVGLERLSNLRRKAFGPRCSVHSLVCSSRPSASR